MFSEELIKYILSLKNCNTTCKKWNKNYKKKEKQKKKCVLFKQFFQGTVFLYFAKLVGG